jgi:hypothetical protein
MPTWTALRSSTTTLGVRLWREVAKGQTERDKPAREGRGVQGFRDLSFHVHSAINQGVCYVNR